MVGLGLIGFGRVGRSLLRVLTERGAEPVSAVSEINPKGRDPQDLIDNLAYLLAHDSTYGRFPKDVGAKKGALIIDGKDVPVYLDTDPALIPWREAGVGILVEASGDEAAAAKAATLAGNAVDKVVITRSAADAQTTLVKGVNLDTYDSAKHHVISCSTCTANALAPVLSVIDAEYGIENASLFSVHPGLSGDTVLDSPCGQFAAGRSGLGVRPVTSHMARTTAQILPGLKGKMAAMSFRVPTLTVNTLAADVVLARPPARAGKIIDVLKQACQGRLSGIVALEEGFLGRARVAEDFVRDPHSAIVDTNWLSLSGSLLRLLIWHDNEYAYCCRVADTLMEISRQAK